MRKKGLSVVIPVYKVEATLDRCVESVLAQDVQDLEIILVDDGSPDRCPQLCDEWERRHPSVVRVIHKPNGGLSDARNTGIRMAQRAYITFVDSDDYVEPGTFAATTALLDSHDEGDIVEYPVSMFEGSKNQHLLTFTDRVYKDVHAYWYGTTAYLHTYAWNKIYRSELFDTTEFPVGRVFEDVFTFPLLLSKARSVITCSKGLYHYSQNPVGITSQARGEEWRMLLSAHLLIANNPLLQPATEDYYLHLLNIQLFTNELTGDRPLMPQVHFNDVRSIKTILYNIVGIRLLCRVNRLFRKVFPRRKD